MKSLILLLLPVAFLYQSCIKEDQKETEDYPIIVEGDSRNTGLKKTPESSYQQIAPAASMPVGAASQLPNFYVLKTPPAAQQGGYGSCLPFAAAYAGMSTIAGGNFMIGNTINAGKVFSPEFLYNQATTDPDNCETGSYFVTTNGYLGVLNILQDQGVCKWSTFPYSDDNGCDNQPNNAQISEAENYKIKKFERIADLSDINSLKWHIFKEKIILIGCVIDQNFQNADEDFVWESSVTNSTGRHAMMVKGYDDSIAGFRLLNSWGQNWGDKGETWLSYSNFDKVVEEAYVLFPDTTGSNNNDNNSSDDDCNNSGIGSVVFHNTRISDVYIVLDKLPNGIDFLRVQGGEFRTLQGICSGLRTYWVYRFQYEAVDNNTALAQDQGNFMLSTSIVDTINVNR